MTNSKDNQIEIIQKTIVQLSEASGWHLTPEEIEQYNTSLQHYLPEDANDLVLRRTIICYHEDHELVESLQDQSNSNHDTAWAHWMTQADKILRSKGLSWSTDTAIDAEDIAQIARMELARSISTFRYSSRFSTWAYQVILRSMIGAVRHRSHKRAAQSISIESSPGLELEISASDREGPEKEADLAVLVSLADRVLSNQPDPRLARMFRLWALEDRRVVEIGALLGLSEARVRALLSQILQLLRAEPAIRDWLEGDR